MEAAPAAPWELPCFAGCDVWLVWELLEAFSPAPDPVPFCCCSPAGRPALDPFCVFREPEALCSAGAFPLSPETADVEPEPVDLALFPPCSDDPPSWPEALPDCFASPEDLPASPDF